MGKKGHLNDSECGMIVQISQHNHLQSLQGMVQRMRGYPVTSSHSMKIPCLFVCFQQEKRMPNHCRLVLNMTVSSLYSNGTDQALHQLYNAKSLRSFQHFVKSVIQFCRKKGVQPTTYKVYQMKWPVSVVVMLCIHPSIVM